MTLIVSPGEDVLSSSNGGGGGSSSDDGDSGCLAGSPPLDLKKDVFLTSKLKRLSLQDVKSLQVSAVDDRPTTRLSTGDLDDHTFGSKNITNGDHFHDFKGKDKDVLDDDHGSPEPPEFPERKLEGPALVTSPVVRLASQVHCIHSDGEKKSVMTMHLTCNNNNNNINDDVGKYKNSCSSLSGDDVTATQPLTDPATPEKWVENLDHVGGCRDAVGETSEVVGCNDDVNSVASVAEDAKSNIRDCKVGLSDSDKNSSIELTSHVVNNIANNTSVEEMKTHLSQEENGQSDIHRAKEKINLLRQNFLSSLSADDDDNDDYQPPFIVLPHHSDHGEEWLEEEEEVKHVNKEEKKEGEEGSGVEEKGKCGAEVTELMAGSEGGSHLTNGGDLEQEVGEKKEEESEDEEREALLTPGVEVSSGECQVMQQSSSCPNDLRHLVEDEKILKEEQGVVITQETNTPIACTPLEGVPEANALPAEKGKGDVIEEDLKISSVKLLVTEASARLLEQELSDGGGTSTTGPVSSDITNRGSSGNVILRVDVTPDSFPSVEGGQQVDKDHSSFAVNLQNPSSTPPSELPPSLPLSPPPPPSSPQSPGLFAREGSSSPPQFLKNQSANFVNLLMLQSTRKHKRLHRLRLPESAPTVTEFQGMEEGERVREGEREKEGERPDVRHNEEECQSRLQQPTTPPVLQSPFAQPPQQHGNQHVWPHSSPPHSPSSPTPSSCCVVAAAANTHCGTTDQLPVCRPGPLSNSPLPPPPTSLPPPLPTALHHHLHSHSSTEYVAGQSHCHHQQRPLRPSASEKKRLGKKHHPHESSDNQRKSVKATSQCRRSGSDKKTTRDRDEGKDGERHGDFMGSGSDTSCLGYLNFDHETFVDSDNDYDLEQKNRLREACKDIARALNTIPSPLVEEEVDEEKKAFSQMYRDARPRYRDQQVEAHLSDTDDPLTLVPDDRLTPLVRSCGTSTTSDDDRRNSIYDNCAMNGGRCECGRCDSTTDVEDDPRGRFHPPPPPPPPGTPPPPPAPPRRMVNKWVREGRVQTCGEANSDYEYVEEEGGFRTDVGEGCRTDDFDVCTTSEDNDYDDDYCQTDDCGEDCDYCSGEDDEDAEDEADDTCYFCGNLQRGTTPVCKHPGVITNGILKSFNGRGCRGGRDGKECLARGVPHGRSLALQAAIHRRRLTRQGLVAIRESSITSDELPESEEEEGEIEEQQSYDGSNCDISSSWRFGLCRELGTSRDSTLRSVRSERSSTSLPSADQMRQRHKEKSNSLPGASSRSFSGRVTTAGGAVPGGVGSPFRQVSTSDEESGSHSSLPRLPPRPPRAPRMRPPLTPSPPAAFSAGIACIAPASPNTPRPAMGLQGLQQQRSPGTPRALHASGLPVAPRTVAPRSPSNPNPPYGFPIVSGPGATLLCPGSPSLGTRSTPSPGAGSEGPPASPRISSRAGALVTRNFSISDDEGGGRYSASRRHVTITRHESVYKEVAEKGYHLPPGSPVDPYWLTWKLGVLQKTVEEVSGRLDEAQKTADGWGPVSHDPNLADQHAHNVRKFREGLAELQRGVDDVNDQAARFSAHNVPLTPANSAKLHDLNNRWKSLETAVNDRWREVASRSREVTPLTPAQLASSVSPPWERATTSNKVPYYINHDQESTHWDHPIMMDLLDSMNEFNHIKFSAYRTATKLRILQKKLALDLAKLQMATDIFDEHGLRGQNDRLIDVGDMVVVLSALYANISADHPDVNTTLAMDLCLNWLLNVYDSQRTGQMRVLSFKIGLVCLCCGHLEEKYRYMFRLIADPNRLVDQRKLGLLLHDCVQVPRQLGEVAAFGGSNIEPSVRSCFTKAGKDRETIEAVHFLTWVQQEPQSLVWLAVLHRVAASESIQHQVKCNICKAYPIVGLRYRCLKCLSFDMCQRCFFDGRSGKSHKITHPMHEYCTATTAGEDMKDFTKALKNKFKSKRSLQKHTKKGYLPVQTVLEGDPLESPSPSPQHNVTSQDMHSRLELYASRLAEVELRTNSNSTPDSEDEHGLIAQYCQSLSSSDAPLPVPRSPLQIMAAADAEQKDELEQMIRALEEENSVLLAEYDRLKSQQPVGSPPDDGLASSRSEADMLAEAKLLRQHKGRLEARMGILEEHNRQLEAQLHRLRQLLGEPGVSSPNKSGTLQTKSVTASQLAMDSPAKLNGHSTQGGATSAYEGLEQMSEYVRPPPPPMGSVAHVGNLFSRAGDLGKAVGTLVATMTHEGENDLPSDEEEDTTNASEDTDDEEEKAV